MSRPGWADPVRQIEERALEIAGLSRQEAFEIDDFNMMSLVAEESYFDLCEAFFERIFVDNAADDKFSRLYTIQGLEQDDIVTNYSDWMVQRMGGMDFYAGRQGLPALMRRHQDLNITSEEAEEWLRVMNEAMDEMEKERELTKNPLVEGRPKMTPLPRKLLMNYFRYLAYYLVAAEETRRSFVAMGGEDLPVEREVMGCPHMNGKLRRKAQQERERVMKMEESERVIMAACEEEQRAWEAEEARRKLQRDLFGAMGGGDGDGENEEDDGDWMNDDGGAWGAEDVEEAGDDGVPIID